MVNLDRENYLWKDAMYKIMNMDTIFVMYLKKISESQYKVIAISQGMRISCPCVKFGHKYSHHKELPKINDLCNEQYLYDLQSHYNVIGTTLNEKIYLTLTNWNNMEPQEKYIFYRKKIRKYTNEKYLIDFFACEDYTNDGFLRDMIEKILEDKEYKEKMCLLVDEYCKKNYDSESDLEL